MNRQSIALAVVLVALAGCQRESTTVDDVSIVNGRRNPIVGTFSGERPVHPEGSINETLVLNADGTFLLTSTDSMIETVGDAYTGTWTMELAGARIRLQPSNRDDGMLFAIASNDALVPLDSKGNSVDPKSTGLRRHKFGH